MVCTHYDGNIELRQGSPTDRNEQNYYKTNSLWDSMFRVTLIQSSGVASCTISSLIWKSVPLLNWPCLFSLVHFPRSCLCCLFVSVYIHLKLLKLSFESSDKQYHISGQIPAGLSCDTRGSCWFHPTFQESCIGFVSCAVAMMASEEKQKFIMNGLIVATV